MRRFLLSLLCLTLLSGCGSSDDAVTLPDTSESRPIADNTQDAAEAVQLPIDQPLELIFASGAGAWGTSLTLSPDGSFSGEFSDSDMGDSDTNYPNGTRYLCNFEGKFTNLTQIDAFTWSLTLDTVSTEVEPDTEWIEDGIRYIASTPYGLDGGTEFLLYLPGTPLNTLPEDFLFWWGGNGPAYLSGKWDGTELDCYGLRNTGTEDGFFTYGA